MRLPICGGNWNNASNAGLSALNLNNLRSNANNNIGSRAAFHGCQKSHHHGDAASACQKRSRTPPLERGNMNRIERLVGFGRMPLCPLRELSVHTVNGLWGKVIDFENLYQAYRRATERKRYDPVSMKFRQNLEENLITLQNELIWKTYSPKPLRHFTIREPKVRQISAPEFIDRVVHHSLVAAIEPAFERRFVADSYACRKGKGTHRAAQKTQSMTMEAKRQWGSYWVLKCDITKYFPSIRHETLKKIVRRTISDKNILWLIDTIIDSHGDGCGIPIGALTSQLLANVYLDQLDHYLKDHIGIRYYVRYMDDFIILGKTKSELKSLKVDIEAYLCSRLALCLNHRTGIWPGRHGIDFCGYRIWPTHMKPRKRTVKKIKRKLMAIKRRAPEKKAFEDIRKVLSSFFGYIKYCNGWRTLQAVLERAAYRPKGARP